MEQNTKLATELLSQIKKDKQRWFIIAIVELIILISIIGLFVWYISLPVDVGSVNQSVGNDGYNQVISGEAYGSDTDSYED